MKEVEARPRSEDSGLVTVELKVVLQSEDCGSDSPVRRDYWRGGRRPRGRRGVQACGRMWRLAQALQAPAGLAGLPA